MFANSGCRSISITARLYTIYGSVLGLEEGRYDEAREAYSLALAIAASVHYFHARKQEALRTSLRAIELAAEVNDPRTELS